MENTRNPIIFIFSGQVVYWERIAEGLYNNEPVFKKWIHIIDEMMHEYYNYSIFNKIKQMTLEQRYKDRDIPINQSFLMMYQIALFKLYKHYGIHPDIIMSHSIGEFSAAYCSGMIDLRTAVRITYNRNLVLNNEGETLMVVNISEDEYNNRFKSKYPNFEISCINSHKSIVIAGLETELVEFSQVLKDQNIFTAFVGSVVGIHCKRFSRFTDSVLDYKLNSKQPKIPIISNNTGQLFGGKFLYDSNYNYQTCVTPVNFNLAMINVFKYIQDNNLGPSPITIELTPHVLLAKSVKDIIEHLNSTYFNKQEMVKNVFTFTRLNHYKQFYSSLKRIYMLQYNIGSSASTKNEIIESKDNTLETSIKSSQDTSIKSTILNYISKQFNIDSNTISTSLGELGADSLFLVGLRNLLDEEYNDNTFTVTQLREFKIQDIIQQVIDNSKNINNKSATAVSFDLEFWKNQVQLDPSIKPHYTTINNSNLNGQVNILLTGGTGYLGTYMIYDYCKSDKVKKIYCLVRNKKSIQQAYDTLIGNLKSHQLYESLNKYQLNKIIPVLGDLSKPKFNLPHQQYEELSSTIDLIVNSAANVDLATNYNENKEVNVIGLIELVKFALNINLKKIITFSSIAVYLNNEFESNGFNDNQLVPLEKLNNLTGYAQSKIVGEHLLNQVSNKFGLDIINIRPPFIYSNPHTGSGNENDLLQLLLQCSYALKSYPNLGSSYQVFQVPITWLSTNIINNFSFNNQLWNNSSSSGNKFKSFNLIGSRQSIETFFGYLENRYPMKMINYSDWVKLVLESKEECCIRLKTFHNLNIVKDIQFSNSIRMTNETIKLISKDWNITDQMIYKNINHTFKLSTSKL